MVSEKDYSYVDDTSSYDDESDITKIRINADNAWEGVELKIGQISAEVLEELDKAKLSFNFTVTNQDPDVAEELENDFDFQHYVGNILTHIIENAFENGDYRIGRNDYTDNDPEESSS